MTKISQESLEKFKSLIDESQSIVICAHVNPDGDALGSSLSLRRSLEKYGKDVFVLKNSQVDNYLNFLPEIDNYKEVEDKDYDLFIILDCSEFDRIASGYEILKRSKKSLVVDHHVGGKITSDLNIIHDDYPATCQLVFEIIDKLALPMDETIATLLYTGIVTDTGRFMYSNVSEKTFEFAAKLTSKGADLQYIYKNLYQNKEISKMKFETEILSRVNFFENKAFVAIDQKTCQEFGVQIGDSETVVNNLRDLKGIELACILKEYGKDEFKVSLRSKEYIDVAEIARNNGGGGHIRAAGFTIKANNMDQAKEIIMSILEKVK